MMRGIVGARCDAGHAAVMDEMPLAVGAPFYPDALAVSRAQQRIPSREPSTWSRLALTAVSALPTMLVLLLASVAQADEFLGCDFVFTGSENVLSINATNSTGHPNITECEVRSPPCCQC